jgi:hypothetical protein
MIEVRGVFATEPRKARRKIGDHKVCRGVAPPLTRCLLFQAGNQSRQE